ncbi:MAG: hypothetical protein HUU01_05105 [Saprospiraceae bacterium]|nr:hypothetical protein [Saprospiraceae bacterium]
MKILEILHSFQKKDWHWFGKFLSSPLHNKHPDVQKLFHFFRQQKHREKIEVNSENLSAILFPETPDASARVHHVSNYLLRAAETYLAWEDWQTNESEQLLCLLSACRQRGLDRHFQATYERLLQRRNAQPERDAQHYRINYRLALEDYQHSSQSGRSEAERLQRLSEWHDIAFIAEKLKNACMLQSRRKVLQAEFDAGMIPVVMSYVCERPHLLNIPAIAVYYYGYLSLSEPREEGHFFALKAQLQAANQQFPQNELRDIYLIAINFCINRINLRQNDWLREVLSLYQTGLAANAFLEHGQISRFTYTNIALVALRSREFEWVRHFLEDYRDKLPEAQREGAYAFNLARYYCETGHYDFAMPLLQKMDFDDVLHNLVAKTMLLRMYYETGAFNALDSLLDSLQTYLRRKRQIGEQQQTAYLNTIRFVRKLIMLPPGKAAARQKLYQEIIDTPLLAEKDWLVQRVMEKGDYS